MSTSRRILPVLGVMLLAALAFAGFSAWRAASEARQALAALDRLQLAADNPSVDALAAVSGDLAALESHLAAARRAARPFLLIAPAFGWLPRIGPYAESGPALLNVAIEVAAGGRQALAAMEPVLAGLAQEGSGEGLGEVVTALRAAEPELAAAEARLARAEELRASMKGAVPGRFEGQITELDRFLPLARAGLQGARMAPALLGADGSRTYLILAQNSDEMRATGGFISAAGYVRLENGRVADLKLMDSYAVDNLDEPHPLPPLPLAEQMGAQILLLRDSNWSPDFPTSAEVARALYAQDQGILTDGAIAVDLEAVRMLVEALGPLSVPGIEGTVTGDNVLTSMRSAWENPAAAGGTVAEAGTSDWWANRKDFMGDLMAVALARLQGGADLNATALAKALLAMLDGRHLQVAVDDPALSALLAARGWDGALRSTKRIGYAEGQDFVAVIDSNVGFNKASAAIQAEMDYRVDRVEGRLQSALTLTYTHTAAALPEKEPCDRTPRYGDSYDEMVRRCYWNYLRVYAPVGAALIASAGLSGVSVEPGESDTTVIAGVYTLRPGDSHTVQLAYWLPETVSSLPYALTVRKQAGAPPWPVRVSTGRCQWEEWLITDLHLSCPAGVD